MQRIWIEFFIEFQVSLRLFLFHIVFATHLIYLLFARFVLRLFFSNMQFYWVFRVERIGFLSFSFQLRYLELAISPSFRLSCFTSNALYLRVLCA